MDKIFDIWDKDFFNPLMNVINQNPDLVRGLGAFGGGFYSIKNIRSIERQILFSSKTLKPVGYDYVVKCDFKELDTLQYVSVDKKIIYSMIRGIKLKKINEKIKKWK